MSETPASEHHAQESYTIIVNGQRRTVTSLVVTYDQVVALAFPGPRDPITTYTVTYRHAQKPHEGDLVEGGSVEIKEEGTVFNVTPTTRS